jgi:hypothetical protein
VTLRRAELWQNETFCFSCMDRSIARVNLGRRSFWPRTFQCRSKVTDSPAGTAWEE